MLCLALFFSLSFCKLFRVRKSAHSFVSPPHHTLPRMSRGRWGVFFSLSLFFCSLHGDASSFCLCGENTVSGIFGSTRLNSPLCPFIPAPPTSPAYKHTQDTKVTHIGLTLFFFSFLHFPHYNNGIKLFLMFLEGGLQLMQLVPRPHSGSQHNV